MMEQMTLNELKTGMHVVTRDGDEYIVLKDTCYGDKCEDDYYKDIIMGILPLHIYTGLSNYREDMTNKYDLEGLDIVAVYSCDVNICAFESIKDNPQAFTQIYAEEKPITRAEAEKLLGRKIVD